MANSSPFMTTRWTRVVAARGDSVQAREALSDLCAVNYEPVLRFLEASGHPESQARELAHEFFADVLQRHNLSGADPAKGRFRSYLLGALKHFLINRHHYHQRQKRGGGLSVLPLETETGTHHGTVPEALRTETPEALFDRTWALGIIARALANLEQEAIATHAKDRFEKLKPWLSISTPTENQSEIAAALQMSEGALKVAIHRLRKRFREVVRQEVSQTLHDPRDLDMEMQHLMAALAVT
jgi:RNA polymerase sigma-70 factor (ECF subfamily)